MKRTRNAAVSLLLCAAVLLSATALPALAEEAAFKVGDKAAGFVVTELTTLNLVNADVTMLQHEKTGAVVMLLENEDNNRVFDISFRTPVSDDTGVPHVFEHATLNGSKKYPSRSLFFNLVYQTYNSFMNAMTGPQVTTYPVASLSEAQLLKYADFYTDSVFNPMIMEDERIFREEAWRYALPEKDGPLGLLGTVYSEMSGSYDINTAGYFDFRALMFPGSQAGNYFGGKPANIPDMTWQHLKDFHDAWYHPSNSLTTLYGKVENPEAFLTLLDGYFSKHDKKAFSYDDTGHTPITAPVTAQVQFPVESGSSTDKGSSVFFGYAVGDATQEDRVALQLLSTLLNEASSPFQQAVKVRLPAATASCQLDTLTPEPGLFFSAQGVDPQDAPVFQAIVEETLAGIRDTGFDLAAVEAVASASRLALLLSTEGPTVGADLAIYIAYHWASSGGDPLDYAKFVDSTANYLPYAESGVYQRVLEKHTANNPRTGLLTISPAPGLKEEQDAALAQRLQAVKDQMTEQELDDLVAATAAAGMEREDDSAQYVAQLQAVEVNTLPEERRMYVITDETGDDRVPRLHAQADVSGVGQALLVLNTDTIPQEDLHWYKLCTDLVGKLDTAQHDNAALTALMTRYLHSLELRPTVYVGAQRTQVMPGLRVSFIAMDEDMAPAYDLVYELLFETSLQDAGKVADALSQVKNALKQFITNTPFQVQVYRAFAYSSEGFRYFNYINYLDYYAFLEQAEALLQSDPDAALKKLSDVRKLLNSRAGAISAFAGSTQSAQAHREAADALLNKLDTARGEAVVYDLPAPQRREALVVDSAVQFNMLYAPNAVLGLEGTTGELDALSSLLTDTYLMPQLREQYGAYGVQHSASEDGVLTLSFMDPNIKETFDVYAAMGDAIENMPLDQQTLDGYILSAYSHYTLSQGELSGALAAMLGMLDGRPQEIFITWMKELKGLTPEKVKAYAGMYRAVYERGHMSTAGGAAAIEQNRDRYDVVYNPFQVKDTPPHPERSFGRPLVPRCRALRGGQQGDAAAS